MNNCTSKTFHFFSAISKTNAYQAMKDSYAFPREMITEPPSSDDRPILIRQEMSSRDPFNNNHAFVASISGGKNQSFPVKNNSKRYIADIDTV